MAPELDPYYIIRMTTELIIKLVRCIQHTIKINHLRSQCLPLRQNHVDSTWIRRDFATCRTRCIYVTYVTLPERVLETYYIRDTGNVYVT